MSEESTVNQFNVEGYTTIKSFIKEDEVKKFTDICLPKSSSIEKDFGTSKNKDIVYQGAIDDAGGTKFWTTDLNQSTNFVKKVVNDIKSNKPLSVSKTRPYGCSVKYG